MYLTTTALVLREVEYKDSDKLLTVLTPEQGKLTLSARGVRKKKDATAAACLSADSAARPTPAPARVPRRPLRIRRSKEGESKWLHRKLARR